MTISTRHILPEVVETTASQDIPSLADWAVDRYILPKETAELSGPWSNDYVPYLMEPMRWLSDMATREVTICACTQSGKTELSNILIGRTVDVAPAPTLVVMPRENDANRRIATRLRPMFKSTPSLLHHLGGKIDNLNIGKETILDNMFLYIAWANSGHFAPARSCWSCHHPWAKVTYSMRSSRRVIRTNGGRSVPVVVCITF